LNGVVASIPAGVPTHKHLFATIAQPRRQRLCTYAHYHGLRDCQRLPFFAPPWTISPCRFAPVSSLTWTWDVFSYLLCLARFLRDYLFTTLYTTLRRAAWRAGFPPPPTLSRWMRRVPLLLCVALPPYTRIPGHDCTAHLAAFAHARHALPRSARQHCTRAAHLPRLLLCHTLPWDHAFFCGTPPHAYHLPFTTTILGGPPASLPSGLPYHNIHVGLIWLVT